MKNQISSIFLPIHNTMSRGHDPSVIDQCSSAENVCPVIGGPHDSGLPGVLVHEGLLPARDLHLAALLATD